MLAIQIIEILWTKATRGAPRANERGALLRAYPLTGGQAPYVVQYFRLAEWKSAFAPELVKVVANPSIPRSEAALSILEQPDGSFKFGFLGEHWGQPKRPALPELFMLLADQYARLVINARHTSYSGQHYSETIYNVTCGQNVASDRFFREKPDYELDLRAHLF